MEHQTIITEMAKINKRIEECMKQYYKQAQVKSEAERVYRIALQQAIFAYKQDKYPATLIPDLARGHTAEQKYQRDLTEALYNTTRDSLRALQAELNSYQTMIRFQSDLVTNDENS